MSLIFCMGMFAVGSAVGVLNAALGIGGGILMVPALRETVWGMDAHTAKGTSLFIIIFVALANAWRDGRRWDRTPWREAAGLACGSILGGYAGAWFTGLLSDRLVTWIFVALLGMVAVRLMLSEPKTVIETSGARRGIAAVAIGAATGIASGMTGIGGGLVLVPLALLFGLASNERVTGLSNLVMVATCAAATIPHWMAPRTLEMFGTVGQINLAVAPAIVLGAQAGSPLGHWVNKRLTYGQRKIALVVLIILIAARMAYRAAA